MQFLRYDIKKRLGGLLFGFDIDILNEQQVQVINSAFDQQPTQQFKVHMPFFRPVKTKKRSKRYEKISHRCMVLLLKKVLCDGEEIKGSAEELDINYSTAKTLMRKYKRKGNLLNEEVIGGICSWYEAYEVERARCTYKVAQNIHETWPFDDAQDSNSRLASSSPSLPQPISPLSLELHASPTKVEILQQVLFKN